MMKRKAMMPPATMVKPGTMKEMPQLDSTQTEARREPRILPKEACEFQKPKMRPRRCLPNQLPTRATAAGNPVA
ncbi:hypothetical protein BV898_06109 [Hypsibius exemplaris]|uniref:Uncharacterized protein n=1 Tax=Hypsibius exemplaris TaxID=2072580 RepID=A0A1W0WXA0_HYPEX|nr:hypothetical protein BV898_06109 [Hypsibius exemplaris]